jgi:hypothetical protein
MVTSNDTAMDFGSRSLSVRSLNLLVDDVCVLGRISAIVAKIPTLAGNFNPRKSGFSRFQGHNNIAFSPVPEHTFFNRAPQRMTKADHHGVAANQSRPHNNE